MFYLVSKIKGMYSKNISRDKIHIKVQTNICFNKIVNHIKFVKLYANYLNFKC